jgi:hypothetical protein
MMARRWLVAAVLLLTLGGCGDEPEAEPATVPVPATTSEAPVPASPSVIASRVAAAVSPARTAPRTTPKAVGRDRADPGAFVAVVQRTMPGLALDRRVEEIAALAQQECAALAAGRSATAVVTEVRTFGTDRAGARQLIKLAVGTVCPEQDRRAGEF